MDAIALLDRLETLISEAARVPLTSKVIVDEDAVYGLIDDLRATLPEEVKQAKWVIKERERYLEEAHRDAEGIVKDAQAEAARKVDESAVTQQAKQQAEDLLGQARKAAQEIRQGANDYAAAVLEKLEGNLQRTIETVKNGRLELKSGVEHSTGVGPGGAP